MDKCKHCGEDEVGHGPNFEPCEDQPVASHLRKEEEELGNHHCSKCGWERLLWRPQDKCAHVLICPLCLMTRPHSSQECDKYTIARIKDLEEKLIAVNISLMHGMAASEAGKRWKALRVWLVDQHNLSPDDREVQNPNAVQAKMSELEGQ